LSDVWLVVDQSFLSLSELAHESSVRLPRNVIALRSLTKDFALAGLRIGYLVAEPELVARIEAARPTWATGAPALQAIECAASQQAFVRESWARMREDRGGLRAGLEALGLRVLPSVAGYQLVEVDDAARTTRALLERGVQVRDATSFGLPQHVRVAARPVADRARLLAAWSSLA
jgi:histidinol-phosphate aminotransferase